MLQIKAEVIDNRTRDNQAIVGLDLQSTFDKVKHSVILSQISALQMGERTYNYVRDFLSGLTPHIQAGDLTMDERKLESVGTPQGSVISPLLFNLVMTGVARRLESIPEVRHTIYADDITLWVPGGCDGHMESSLQLAVDAIEEQLQGTGLVCSPRKSELLIIPPLSRLRQESTIKLRTSNGQTIPEVAKIRVLGFLIERNRRNNDAVTRLVGKVTAATQLIKQVANIKFGMREDSLLRLIQSFAISHVAYAAAFHNLLLQERNRLNAAIRKSYKAAIGVLDIANTEKLFELGIHNTLEEIMEAQQVAQIERLKGSKTGRSILARLGMETASTTRSPSKQEERDIPVVIRNATRVNPLPKNMDPTHNKDRRMARAKAMLEQHLSVPGTRFVDAAEYSDRRCFAAVVIDARTGDTVNAASIITREAQCAD
ncbi:uncharacterized protein LOC144166439 [Haemaphysalis longicornis]